MGAAHRLAAGVIIALLAYWGASAFETARTEPKTMRGALYDIGEGRRMRLVCEGPDGARPTVLFEAGAFGFAADWGAVQQKVTQLGMRSCAYDRAGLGLSDPGPSPRDAEAIYADLDRLLAAAHERGPFILVAHSMGGLYVRMFAARRPADVAGLVLVDATTPEAADVPAVQGFIRQFSNASQLASAGATLGLYAPLAGTWFGDKIGLPAEASREKRRAFASARHNRAAASEVREWMRSAAEARLAGRLDPGVPVAIVTPARGPAAGYRSLQFAPAHESRHGRTEEVQGANHSTLLGLKFADHVVAAITFVRDAGAPGA